MPDLKLTDIPIELRSHIISKLSLPPPFSSPKPTAFTIESIQWVNDIFCDDMLHTAQASKALSRAVVYNLGPHAQILSFLRSNRLSEWISILGKHVKAFGLTGASELETCEEDCEENCKCDNLHKGMLKTLKALHTNDVSLVALDIEDLETTDPYRAEEIAEVLIKALRRSSSSLKEMALHVNWATAMALPAVTLPKLDIVQISSFDHDSFADLVFKDLPNHSQLLSDILESLNGHTNRYAKISTVRELRLLEIYEAPTVDRGKCLSLFSAIQDLVLTCRPTSNHNEIAMFIANFRSLRTLQWVTESICPEDMNNIFAGCPELNNLELFIENRNILPEDIPVAENTSRLNDLFVSFRGKLEAIVIQSNLSCSHIHSLAENNPNLLALKMEIDFASVEALGFLLAIQCRKLRMLKVRYSRDANDCLGPNGWPAFARAICSSSNELLEISFEANLTGPMLESATFEMVEAIIDILEFMGDRAFSVEFRVPMGTRNPFTVMETVHRTLNVAKIHCRSIQNLCLDYIPEQSNGS